MSCGPLNRPLRLETTMTRRPGRTTSTPGAVVLLAAGLALADTAQAEHDYFHVDSSSSTVTTNAYSDTSTSADPDESCLDMSMDAGGVLRGYCNFVDSDGTVEHITTQVDLDAHAGCDAGVLAWAQTDITSDATGLTVQVNSAGSVYQILGLLRGRQPGRQRPLQEQRGRPRAGLRRQTGAERSRSRSSAPPSSSRPPASMPRRPTPMTPTTSRRGRWMPPTRLLCWSRRPPARPPGTRPRTAYDAASKTARVVYEAALIEPTTPLDDTKAQDQRAYGRRLEESGFRLPSRPAGGDGCPRSRHGERRCRSRRL